jgi:hypothetical protein
VKRLVQTVARSGRVDFFGDCIEPWLVDRLAAVD